MCVEGGEKEREREGGGVGLLTTSRSTRFRALVANSLGIR